MTTKTFREDNTDGFSAEELAAMNAEYDNELADSPYENDPLIAEQLSKAIAERVLRRHDAA